MQLERASAEKVLWEDMYSHHVLPVFAAARAFVPSSFESLLVQVRYFHMFIMRFDFYILAAM
jgi:hypothetical protein